MKFCESVAYFFLSFACFSLFVSSVQKCFLSFVIVSCPCNVILVSCLCESFSIIYSSTSVVIQSFVLFYFFRQLQHRSFRQSTNRYLSSKDTVKSQRSTKSVFLSPLVLCRQRYHSTVKIAGLAKMASTNPMESECWLKFWQIRIQQLQ